MRKIVWTLLIVFAGFCAYSVYGPKARELPAPAPLSPEEKKYVRDAHRLGTRLLAISQRAEDLQLEPQQRQERLKPVYNQIETFLLQHLAEYRDRIESITVNYDPPGVQCYVYVKPGSDAELEKLKKTSDACVGRIIENLPMVKYLMIKNQEPPKQR